VLVHDHADVNQPGEFGGGHWNRDRSLGHRL
jgi:hypothetical protein